MGFVSLLRTGGIVAIVVGALPLAASPAPAGEEIFVGPVRAQVLKVLDGDTFSAEALVWPGHTVRVNVRIRGIDAPEMKSRCAAERLAALKAREELEGLIASGVSIANIGGAKYYGRVLADVTTNDGTAVAEALIERALARPYDGGKRRSWCG